MAEETKKSAEEVVVSDVPLAEESTATVVEKEAPPLPEPVKDEKVVEGEKEEKEPSEESKINESSLFKEESNKVDDLVALEKTALDELKLLVREALDKHEFTVLPPPIKEEEKKPEEKKMEEPKPAEKKEDEESKSDEKKEDEASKSNEKKEEPKTETCETKDEVPASTIDAEEVKPEAEVVSEKNPEEETIPPPVAEEKKSAEPVVGEVEEVESVVEEIKETIVLEVTAAAPPTCEEPVAASVEEEKPEKEQAEEENAPLPLPEEVSIWGIPLLADEKSDVILLKFLRARDFKVQEAFSMLKSVVAWRKKFGIEELVEEEGIIEGLEKVVYIHGVDKEGHPVSYNAFGEFQDKELYHNTFADAEKRGKFLKWYIKFLEKNVRKLDFTPDGTCTIVQITDLKNSPGLFLFKKEIRQTTNLALQLLQDNYPEFVAKQVFINVPWWYVAYNRMISPFLTQRTKSKFVFAGPTKTTETLFKYLAPEQVPVQYGGLSKDGEHEFTDADASSEETIKPASKYSVELPINEACTLVWEVRVVGWDVAYGAEFVPSAEGGYTWIVQKSRKIAPIDEQVINCTFKIDEPGKVVLTFDNQTSKKKKLIYRSKIHASG